MPGHASMRPTYKNVPEESAVATAPKALPSIGVPKRIPTGVVSENHVMAATYFTRSIVP